MGKEHIQERRHKIKIERAESQDDSSFPGDGLQDASKQQTYKSRFNTEMIQDEYSTARQTLNRWSDQRRSIESQPI